MSDADKRISDLLDRWAASLELHTRYLKLDDTEYAKVQAWPKHQRPNRWIVDLAKQRVSELRHHLKDRKESGDDEFSDALELMGFLTSLLATEHLERFIPLAMLPKDSTVRQATIKPEPVTASTVRARAPAAPGRTATATAPAAKQPAPPPKQPAPRPAAPKSSSGRAVSARPATPANRPAVPASRPAAPASRAAPVARRATRAPNKLSDQTTKLVISDAVRMLEWGSEWPQIAGLIARLADRPSEREIWSVLSEHRATIEARAKGRSA